MSSDPSQARWAEASDRSELVRMRQSLWPDSTEAEVDDLLGGKIAGYAVLVAPRIDGGLCGFAEVGERGYAEGCSSSPVAYLEGIWVDPDRRRGHVGLALVAAANAWARSRGLTEFASDCSLGNTASRLFHAAAGFREVSRLVTFHRYVRPNGA